MASNKRKVNKKGDTDTSNNISVNISVSDTDDVQVTPNSVIQYYDHLYQCSGQTVMKTRYEMCKHFFGGDMFIHHLCQVFVQNDFTRDVFMVHYPKGSKTFVNSNLSTKFTYILGEYIDPVTNEHKPLVHVSDTYTFLTLCYDYTMNTKPKSHQVAFDYVKGEVRNAYNRSKYNPKYGVKRENGVFAPRYDD